MGMRPIVVKLSSQFDNIMPLAKVIAGAMRCGKRIVVVAGGAVKRGLSLHGLTTITATTLQMQAAAGVGQLMMMSAWTDCLGELGIWVAQLQLTHHVLDDPTNNIAQVIEQILDWGQLPVANGLDTVTNEETVQTGKISENSGIASRLAVLIKAETLALLGMQPCIFTSNPVDDPAAKPIREVTDPSDAFLDQFPEENAQNGSFGGNRRNVESCLYAARRGVKVFVAQATRENLEQILGGDEVGTIFRPNGS